MPRPSSSLDGAMQALAAHHPTWRHGSMLFDLIVAGLGPLAVVDTADAGTARWLYRRVAEGASEIVPWPVATYGAVGLDKGYIQLTEDSEDRSWATPEPVSPPSRLSGMRSGRICLFDGHQKLELGYGDDGRLKERCIDDRYPGRLEGLEQALSGRGAAPPELAAAFVTSLDHGRHAAARARMPVPMPGGVGSIWARGCAGARRALFDGRVPPSARFLVVDGVSGTAIGWGATLEEAQAAYESEVRREQPHVSREIETITDDYDDDGNLIARGDPGAFAPSEDEAASEASEQPPTPQLDPVTRRVDFGTFVIRGPTSDVPLPTLTLASTPSVVVPLDPSPPAPPPWGRWVRLLSTFGSTHHAVRLKSGDGFLLVGARLLPQIDRQRLPQQLDAADERNAADFGSERLGFPEMQPFVRFEAVDYRWEPARGEKPAQFRSNGCQSGPRFDAGGLEGDAIEQQVRRQVRVRRGSRS